MPNIHRAIAITDRSSIGEARRASVTAADALGFAEDQRSKIGTVVTEAATNILLHAASGEVLVCPAETSEGTWLDAYALDHGPGIVDMARALEDGFSTQGTPGHGLGAIQRQSDVSGIYSSAASAASHGQPAHGRGTVNWSRFLLNPPSPDANWGAISVPLKGESVCGDAFLVVPGASRTLFIMADGLGHGGPAHEAAQAAIEAARQSATETPAEIIQTAHNALRATRGAAMSVAAVDHERRVITYAGVGNISATLVKLPPARNFVSQNGTVGAVLPRVVQDYTYPFEPDSVLVMFSDGLASRTSLNGYAGVQSRHPALLAGILFRDFSRRRDDATVLAARLEGPPR